MRVCLRWIGGVCGRVNIIMLRVEYMAALVAWTVSSREGSHKIIIAKSGASLILIMP